MMETLILIEYLEGTLDEITSKEVEYWLSASKENEKILEDLYTLLFVSSRIKAMQEVDTEQAFKEFLIKKATLSQVQPRRIVSSWRRIASVAAIVLFLISATYGTLFFLDRYSEPFIVSTRFGEKAQVILPDGSNVWLNACSHLEYKRSFLSPTRKANLKGEAYFEVSPDKLFPFTVTSKSSTIKVLGTKFNVRCNEDEEYISTTLLEGSILFSDNNSNISKKLNPGEKLLFDRKKGIASLEKVTSPEDILGWMEGRLTFFNASLSEITQSLERYYNVEIIFRDEELKEERFTAEFEVTENIYHILSMLELTNRFTYEVNNRQIIITK